MADVQKMTSSLFKPIYDLLEQIYPDTNEQLIEMKSTISIAVYDSERAVMLEIIKMKAVEDLLTNRVLLYADTTSCIDELTGKISD